MLSDFKAFQSAFSEFKSMILEASGYEFTNFNEGRAAVWESYKLRLREYALSILNANAWLEVEIGNGRILGNTIEAIEIQSAHSNLTNNLVFWQNRFGHASRAHKSFIEAINDKQMCHRVENALFDLFRRDSEQKAFTTLNEISDGKYPLIAYLFFLKDEKRFMPILPSTYDKAFQLLNIDLVTLRKCSWENYLSYNLALKEVSEELKKVVTQKGLDLIDAHSFCFLLIKTREELNSDEPAKLKKDDGVVLGEQDRRVWDMKDSVLKTVANSNGQTIDRLVKVKKLKMSDQKLSVEIKRLMNLQGHRCALTGLNLDYSDNPIDLEMRPSLDRIDSNGHYELGNLQVVCRFVNFWKSNQDNDEFLRLLNVLRRD